MRQIVQYENPTEEFKQSLLLWAADNDHCLILDHHSEIYHSGRIEAEFDLMIARGAFQSIGSDPTKNPFENLNEFIESSKDWIVGHLGYDLKNDIEQLHSNHPDFIGFPPIFFFVPEHLILKKGTHYLFYIRKERAHQPFSDLLRQIEAYKPADQSLSQQNPAIRLSPMSGQKLSDLLIKQRINQSSYLEKVKKIQSHIQKGDIYEASFCMEFFCECLKINPLELYQILAQVSPTPFGSYYRMDSKHLMSASPERFLKKKGSKIISQPIKGTIRRSIIPEEDMRLRNQLANDPKERAENIMIVDLVRNDLSRTAKRGSVNVDEICGIYTYPQVHQMISTISAEVSGSVRIVDILKNAFPMGSMTGAPKIRAMQILEETEETKRGNYSGSIGYINPTGDFDFNVVIRSFGYNADAHYLNWMVGGAITSLSTPEEEYNECLLKAKAMELALKKLINLT